MKHLPEIAADRTLRILYPKSRKHNTLSEVALADDSQAELAIRLKRSFRENIQALCRNRSPLARFDIFEHALPLDVKRIVLASATKSCQ